MKKNLVCSLMVATLLWFLMFAPVVTLPFGFWWAMSGSAVILMALALGFGGKPPLHFSINEINMGVGFAVVLWCIFWVGDKVAEWLFCFARPQIDLIYSMKDGQDPLWVSLALLCVIGPAEELFWRGYVQRTLWAAYSPDKAFVITTAVYTLVHLPSCNFMLIMAALVCGIVWGGLYRLMSNNLTAIVLSHAIWDASAFVWHPF
ncbi:MAG: CPBP family intramembrane metalloprotease [Bacteroidaceae bacterium]|nr:CPBP family intramembrane metalloprotease [Bacteroidaceae bacterium]